MDYTMTSTAPAAFTVPGAVSYSGLTRTFLYENRDRVDWIKAGRRSLITRESLDRLLFQLLQEAKERARPGSTARRERKSIREEGDVK